ncbi:MAG: peptidase S41 [Paludibacteraceae bacterium]|nr:peptidase S41 [Paludibacteraceae bacterium]
MKKGNDILIPEFARLLKEGHLVEFSPRGVSMRPFIEGGRDKVILQACTHPMVGMIVLAKINNSYVLHRIYKIQNSQITLCGDGNLKSSERCTSEDIIGCVVQLKGKDGKLKRVTKGGVWRHLPTFIKRLYLKIYIAVTRIKSMEYED